MKSKRKKKKTPNWEDQYGWWGLTKNGTKVGILKDNVIIKNPDKNNKMV